MMRSFIIIYVCILALFLAGCAHSGQQEQPSNDPAAETETAAPQTESAPDAKETAGVTQTEEEEEEANVELHMLIDGVPVAVAWEDNDAVRALKALCEDAPLTIPMAMYGGFEQVGPIGASLPSDDRQTTTAAGDIVLYDSSRLVVFYGSNSWAYTRLGHITDRNAAELAELLGSGDVTVTIRTGDAD